MGSGSEPGWGCKAGPEAELLSTRPLRRPGSVGQRESGGEGSPTPLCSPPSSFLRLELINTWRFSFLCSLHSGKPSACQSYRIS